MGLPAKSDKSDWLRIRNHYSAHAQNRAEVAEVTSHNSIDRGHQDGIPS